MAWSPNDIVLSIDAYLRLREAPDQSEAIIGELCELTGADAGAVRAAIEAVGQADPRNGRGPRLPPFARHLATYLLTDRRELQRLVRVIRDGA